MHQVYSKYTGLKIGVILCYSSLQILFCLMYPLKIVSKPSHVQFSILHYLFFQRSSQILLKRQLHDKILVHDLYINHESAILAKTPILILCIFFSIFVYVTKLSGGLIKAQVYYTYDIKFLFLVKACRVQTLKLSPSVVSANFCFEGKIYQDERVGLNDSWTYHIYASPFMAWFPFHARMSFSLM